MKEKKIKITRIDSSQSPNGQNLKPNRFSQAKSASSFSKDAEELNQAAYYNPNTQQVIIKKIGAGRVFWIFFFSLIFGIIGGIFARDYILPAVADLPYISDIGFFRQFREGVSRQQADITEETLVVEEESAIVDAVNKISPAVVSINIEQSVQDIFGQEFIQNGGGTGFILTEDGVIATNKHVVSDPTASYTVTREDGTEYNATIESIDPLNDFAIIKINADNLPIVELGDSDNLQAGQRVIALGNALAEYQNTVTVGFISATERNLLGGNPSSDFAGLEGAIQTDAALNPGNSGGPLLNLKGQVIGINSAIDQGGQLISFAIPINDVKTAIDSYLETGQILRPYIGIRYALLNETIAETLDLASSTGAYLIESDLGEPAVLPDSPAAKAGLKEGDIILQIDDQDVKPGHSIARLVQKYQPGDEVNLSILRGTDELSIRLELGQLE